MKKIIIILSAFIMCSCYNYIEVNDLCFISAIGVDYKDNKYYLTYEIIEETRIEENSMDPKSSIITSSGKTIASAFNNITLKINKKPFYYHLKSLVVSKEIATNHMEEITDFFTRNPEIRNEFYLVIAQSTEQIIKSSNKNIPVVGDEIAKAIETGDFNSAYDRTFEDILEKLLNNKMDMLTTEIELKEGKIAIKGIAIFKGYKYIKTLSSHDSTLINILNNNKANLIATKYYGQKPFNVMAFYNKSNYKFKNNKIILNVKMKAEIVENAPNFDLHDEKIYKKLNDDLSSVVKNDIEKLLIKIKATKADPLGLNQKQYIKTKKNVNNIMEKYTFDVNVDLIINRKGLIYKVNNE